MNKPRKKTVLKERFAYVLKVKNRNLRKLCEEKYLSYDTIRSCIRNQKMMSDNIDTLAEALDCDPLYLRGEYNNHIPNNSPFYKYYSERGRLDSDGFDMGTYVSSERITAMNDRLQVLAKYMELLGIRGIDGSFFDDEKMQYFTPDQIAPYITDSFEYKVIKAIVSILKEEDFFSISDERLPLIKESEDN